MQYVNVCIYMSNTTNKTNKTNMTNICIHLHIAHILHIMYIDVIYGQDAGSCQAQTRWGGDGDHSFRHSSCLSSGAALLSISSVVENSVKPLLTPDKWTNAKYAEVISWHILHILHMTICKICIIWTVNYYFAYLFAYCSIFICILLHIISHSILHILHIAICKICRIWTVHYYFAYIFCIL